MKNGKNILSEIEKLAEKRKNEILNLPDALASGGCVYYVSADGDDENDGRSEATPWKTLSRVSSFEFAEGDEVRFRRGDVFRGFVKTRPSVKYCAYGVGEKPRLYGSEKDYADPNLWEIYDSEKHVWKLKEKALECGTLVFNGGEAHSRKLIPSYRGGRFVCRYDEEKEFIISEEMTENLDVFCKIDSVLTEKPSKGEEFPIPALDGGRLLFLLVEAVRGKPLPPEKEGVIHFAGFVVLMIIMVLVLFNDIQRIIG